MQDSVMQLAILARAPVPGQCKTRLIPTLGAEGAAALHARLVEYCVNTALMLPDVVVTLWTAGAANHAFFQQLAERFPQLQWQEQPAGDLGERMHQVFVHTGQPTLLIGSDCPVLTVDVLQDCADHLKNHAAVFVPAEDGGYVLVGLQSPCRALFAEVDWGTDQVMQQTRQRLQQQQMPWVEPLTLWDVDRPEDLQRLAL
jgi:uncharacterized protein